ncbi:MAG: putative high-affinity branched-chain amino acid transport protein superfamily, atp bind [Solirubrobacterales bacterium]|nr:putative high-affinity branched-chain amino acid transport protein superfamily, atp bind [Solirubrobacterales bacterium]
MTAVVEAKGVDAGYGAQPVVHGLDLEVHEGQVVCLLGPNGAGKTTTMLTLSGELPQLAGEVYMHGAPTHAPLHRRARAGLSYVTEERSVFKGMSARDNLRCGGVDPVYAIALFPELEKCMGTRGGLLSGGEQQMLTLARALGRHPRVLLADELSLGLAPLVVDRLLAAVRQAATESGTGALIVEQHARKALRYADRVYVMSRGRIVMALDAAEARARLGEIETAYLSGAAGPEAAAPPPAPGAVPAPQGRPAQP